VKGNVKNTCRNW